MVLALTLYGHTGLRSDSPAVICQSELQLCNIHSPVFTNGLYYVVYFAHLVQMVKWADITKKILSKWGAAKLTRVSVCIGGNLLQECKKMK